MSKLIKNSKLVCLCGSAKPLTRCCLGVIEGDIKAQSAEQLMRSRYSGYALGKAKYILKSWHFSTRPAQLELNPSQKWCGLKVLTCRDTKDKTAYVEFIASYRFSGEMGQIHERSRFVLEAGEWFYVDGEQIDSVAQHKNILPNRNELCHCGSGKKFKKCCIVKR